jgi:copper(I)-binding protein
MFFRQLARAAGLALLINSAVCSGAFAEKKIVPSVEAGDLLIDTPWTRATPGGAKVGAGYMSIVNRGDASDRLVAGKSDISERVEIHTMTMEGGVMRMRQLKDGLVLAPKSITELKPGGYHVMFIGLKRAIAKDDKVAVQLTFEKAGSVDLTLTAAAIGAMSAPGKPADAGAAAGSRSGTAGSDAGAGSRSGHNAAGSRAQ